MAVRKKAAPKWVDPKRTKTKGRHKQSRSLSDKPVLQKVSDYETLFTLTPDRTKALVMLLNGETVKNTAEAIGVNDRTIRKWAERFGEIFTSEEQAKIITKMFSLVGKSLGVLEKYLDGKGKEEGGDLRAAMRVLQTFGALASEKGGIFIDQSRNATINAPANPRQEIPIKAEPDDYFAEGAPVELQRMLRLLAVPGSSPGNGS